MIEPIRIKQLIPAPKETVFSFWTKPELLEKWASPKGMTVKIPEFDARTGGKYRYEHTNKDGTYVCTGYFKEFIPEQKLVHVDNVFDPSGKQIYTNQETAVTFMESPSGTTLNIIVSGFDDQAGRDGCEQGYTESLENLYELLSHARFHPGQDLRDQQQRSV
jgi:uncharacterized protein YndB with AHSA1/START domain